MMERTRFAPSPTGMLHIGGVRTALWAYFLAKQTGGAFLLRIEDTDQARSVEGGVHNIVSTLNRLGITADEGPVLKDGAIVEVGEKGPYTQSSRLDLYRSYADKLVAAGDAYHCFCSKERLDTLRKSQQEQGKQPGYDRHCLNLTDAEVQERLGSLQNGDAHVIRMRIPEGSTTFTDRVRGDVTFQHTEIDDQVILKSDGFPTYHLAVVVDDHHMGITTVIRGEEWLTSTPKHLILYKALGFEAPRFAHVPLLLNSDKSKLSKRQGDVAADSYLEKGYLPEAIVNFIATLGYNPSGDRELYALKELVDLFNIDKVKKSGAVVNFGKLDWMNKQYLAEQDTAELQERIEQLTGERIPQAIVAVEKQRVTTLRDFAEAAEVYGTVAPYEPGILVWRKSDAKDAKAMLTAMHTLLQQPEYAGLDAEALEERIKGWIQSEGLQTGAVLWPLRVALSGRERSPSPFDYLSIIDREEALQRIQHGIDTLN